MRAKQVIHRELDQVDVKLVRALQENCRVSMTDLAEKVGLSGHPLRGAGEAAGA